MVSMMYVCVCVCDCAEHAAHEGFELFDVDFLLLLGRHGVVSCNELGESPDEESEQDEEG